MQTLPENSRRVILGPSIGEDAAAISFGSINLIVKSDPVTFASDMIGWYSVQINANDIAATGGTPLWFLPTILIPEGASLSLVEKIFRQLSDAANNINVEIIGGHSEITQNIFNPIVCGTMIGEARPSMTVSTSGAKIGDAIIMTGYMGIEGTSIIARDRFDDLLVAAVPKDLILRAQEFLYDPGISIVKDAHIALESGKITAMHDPTEGGLSTGLMELAFASNVLLEIEEEKLPVRSETVKIAKVMGVDIWGLLSSGALLITCPENDASAVIQNLRIEGRSANLIGKVKGEKSGVVVKQSNEKIIPLKIFERDEITKLFNKSTNLRTEFNNKTT